MPVWAVHLANSTSFIAQRTLPPTMEESSLLAASSLRLPSPKIQHNSGTEFLLLLNYNSFRFHHGETHSVCMHIHSCTPGSKKKLAEVYCPLKCGFRGLSSGYQTRQQTPLAVAPSCQPSAILLGCLGIEAWPFKKARGILDRQLSL